MEKRYSQMTESELRQEIADLKIKAQKAEMQGMINEVAVLERKSVMAQAYLLDKNDFKSGNVYVLKDGDETLFKLDYLDGVFGWGYYGNETEMRAIPISLLIEK